MDLNQLRTFLTLSKVKNFTKTAAVLGYAQSSITVQIQQLEKELGSKLFERIGKNVTLTMEGNALIPYATQIVTLSDNMKDAVLPSDKLIGRITIGASESLSIYRLPAIIKAFKEIYPNIDIFLKLLTCNEFVPSLLDNTIDIAFSIGDKIDDPSMKIILEKPEPIMILACPNHPFASFKRLQKKDFNKGSFILTGHGCCYRGAFEKDMRSAGNEFKVVLETDSLQAIKQTAMSGLGICVLPQIAVLEEIRNNKLIPLAYKNNYPIVSQLIHHKSKWISPLLADFIKITADQWDSSQ